MATTESNTELDGIGRPDLLSAAGKYLTFSLSKESYGIGIEHVLEIFGMRPITRVPRCSEFIKGVINLRGKIIPVVDLRQRFHVEAAPYDDKTCIIVANVTCKGSKLAVGLIVDTVLEVYDFTPEALAISPDYGVQLDTRSVIGMGTRKEGDVVVLIDIEKAFSRKESDGLKAVRDGGEG